MKHRVTCPQVVPSNPKLSSSILVIIVLVSNCSKKFLPHVRLIAILVTILRKLLCVQASSFHANFLWNWQTDCRLSNTKEVVELGSYKMYKYISALNFKYNFLLIETICIVIECLFSFVQVKLELFLLI